MACVVKLMKPWWMLSFSRLSRLLCFKRNIFPFKTAWKEPHLEGGGRGVGAFPCSPLPPTLVALGAVGKLSSKSILKGKSTIGLEVL